MPKKMTMEEMAAALDEMDRLDAEDAKKLRQAEAQAKAQAYGAPEPVSPGAGGVGETAGATAMGALDLATGHTLPTVIGLAQSVQTGRPATEMVKEALGAQEELFTEHPIAGPGVGAGIGVGLSAAPLGGAKPGSPRVPMSGKRRLATGAGIGGALGGAMGALQPEVFGDPVEMALSAGKGMLAGSAFGVGLGMAGMAGEALAQKFPTLGKDVMDLPMVLADKLRGSKRPESMGPFPGGDAPVPGADPSAMPGRWRFDEDPFPGPGQMAHDTPPVQSRGPSPEPIIPLDVLKSELPGLAIDIFAPKLGMAGRAIKAIKNRFGGQAASPRAAQQPAPGPEAPAYGEIDFSEAPPIPRDAEPIPPPLEHEVLPHDIVEEQSLQPPAPKRGKNHLMSLDDLRQETQTTVAGPRGNYGRPEDMSYEVAPHDILEEHPLPPETEDMSYEVDMSSSAPPSEPPPPRDSDPLGLGSEEPLSGNKTGEGFGRMDPDAIKRFEEGLAKNGPPPLSRADVDKMRKRGVGKEERNGLRYSELEEFEKAVAAHGMENDIKMNMHDPPPWRAELEAGFKEQGFKDENWVDDGTGHDSVAQMSGSADPDANVIHGGEMYKDEFGSERIEGASYETGLPKDRSSELLSVDDLSKEEDALRKGRPRRPGNMQTLFRPHEFSDLKPGGSAADGLYDLSELPPPHSSEFGKGGSGKYSDKLEADLERMRQREGEAFHNYEYGYKNELPQSVQDQIVKLAADGHGLKQIANAVRLSDTQVARVLDGRRRLHAQPADLSEAPPIDEGSGFGKGDGSYRDWLFQQKAPTARRYTEEHGETGETFQYNPQEMEEWFLAEREVTEGLGPDDMDPETLQEELDLIDTALRELEAMKETHKAEYADLSEAPMNPDDTGKGDGPSRKQFMADEAAKNKKAARSAGQLFIEGETGKKDRSTAHMRFNEDYVPDSGSKPYVEKWPWPEVPPEHRLQYALDNHYRPGRKMHIWSTRSDRWEPVEVVSATNLGKNARSKQDRGAVITVRRQNGERAFFRAKTYDPLRADWLSPKSGLTDDTLFLMSDWQVKDRQDADWRTGGQKHRAGLEGDATAEGDE